MSDYLQSEEAFPPHHRAQALDGECRLVALARALGALAVDRLGDRVARYRAYAGAGLMAWSDRDDAEALRRALIFRTRVGPAPGVIPAPRIGAAA